MREKLPIILLIILIIFLIVGGYFLWQRDYFGFFEKGEVERPLDEKDIEELAKEGYFFNLDMALNTRRDVYRLELANKELEELSPRIGELTDLRFLNLSNNDLTEIPKEIGNLINLRQLHLVNNNLSSLPEEISNLEKLEVLGLTGNNFDEGYIEDIKEMLPQATILVGFDEVVEEEDVEDVEEEEEDVEEEEEDN